MPKKVKQTKSIRIHGIQNVLMKKKNSKSALTDLPQIEGRPKIQGPFERIESSKLSKRVEKQVFKKLTFISPIFHRTTETTKEHHIMRLEITLYRTSMP